MKTIIKRINSLMAVGVLALSAVLGTVVLPQQATAMGGDGEPTWIIQNCNDLRQLYLGVSAYTHDLTYELANDIDCNGVSMGTIGFGGNEALTGTFDGKGHTISNLTISQPSGDLVGLFGFINGGTVRNLGLTNVAIAGNFDGIGALAGNTEGATIENVHVTSGSVGVLGSGAEAGNIGGLVGYSSSSNYSNVTANVVVDGGEGYRVGGLIGTSDGDDIQQAAAYGDVTGYAGVGGLAGGVFGSTLVWVHAKGNVAGASHEAGGLVGVLADTGSVASAYARGSVSGPDKVGGLVGAAYDEFSISYSYSTGEVIMTSEGAGGGLIGTIESEGGFIGENTFWDVEASGFDSNHGNAVAGKTTAEMKTLSTFTSVGWDFTDEPIWRLVSTSNDGYPCHAWEDGCETSGGNNNGGNNGGNNGDGNKQVGEVEIDGNTANLTTATGSKQVTLTVDESCTLSDVSTVAPTSLSAKDSAYTYNTGFVKFTATGCADDATEVQLLYHGVSPDDVTVRKHNPNTNAFFTITSATKAKVGNDTLVTYTIIDDGDLDINKTPGVITDPVGLGSLAIGVPNTGLGGGVH